MSGTKHVTSVCDARAGSIPITYVAGPVGAGGSGHATPRWNRPASGIRLAEHHRVVLRTEQQVVEHLERLVEPLHEQAHVDRVRVDVDRLELTLTARSRREQRVL